jgi:hypothetical protein
VISFLGRLKDAAEQLWLLNRLKLITPLSFPTLLANRLDFKPAAPEVVHLFRLCFVLSIY